MFGKVTTNASNKLMIYIDTQTSVILQSRLCQSPSERVGDGLKSCVPPRTTKQGDGRREEQAERGGEGGRTRDR